MEQQNPLDDFRRDISYRVFRRDGKIALTATLQDIFHDIYLEITVEPDTMVISSALVNFQQHPSEHCPAVEKVMEKLLGVVIGKGLNRRLVEIFGGSTGCGNIRTMLMGLLPLALNARIAAGISDQQEMHARIRQELSGTCAGYPASDNYPANGNDGG